MTIERRKKRRSSRDFLWILIGIIVFLVVIVLGRQEHKIYQIKQEMAATKQRVEELKKLQIELKSERQRLDDIKYIEKLAREDHNMVGQGEVPLFIVEEQQEKEQGKESKP